MNVRFTKIGMEKIKGYSPIRCNCGHDEDIKCQCGGTIRQGKSLEDHRLIRNYCDECGSEWSSYGLHLLHTTMADEKKEVELNELV